jgi:ribosome-interacting GTPase 1
MPANLTPEYRAAEQQLMQAKTPVEKLAALRLMLSRIPKHKGTDKLQADLKRRIARLNDEIRSQVKQKGFAVHVEREGAAQVVVVGPPNAGKSRLVSELTGVALEVAPYPFTTQRPAPAMMPYQDIQIQLVDLPPVSAEHTEAGVFGIVRAADAVLLVVDLSAADVLDRIEEVITALGLSKLKLAREAVESDPAASVASKQCRLVGTKLDLPGSRGNLEVLQELYGERFGISAVSSESGENMQPLREGIFRILRLVRVYSKPPHEPADVKKPFVLQQGSTLRDFANTVHHDFAERLKYARVWGHGKFEGQRINRDYTLCDRDVIELHL